MAKQIQDSIGRLHATEQECAKKIEQARRDGETRLAKTRKKSQDILDTSVQEAEDRKKDLLKKHRAAIKADVEKELSTAQTAATNLKKATAPDKTLDFLLATLIERHLKGEDAG